MSIEKASQLFFFGLKNQPISPNLRFPLAQTVSIYNSNPQIIRSILKPQSLPTLTNIRYIMPTIIPDPDYYETIDIVKHAISREFYESIRLDIFSKKEMSDIEKKEFMEYIQLYGNGKMNLYIKKNYMEYLNQVGVIDNENLHFFQEVEELTLQRQIVNEENARLE